MSQKAFDWALKVKKISWQSKLLLVVMAVNHDESTDVCAPPRSLLAEQCNASVSWVAHYLKELLKSGLIKREQRKDDKNQTIPSQYWLQFHLEEPFQ